MNLALFDFDGTITSGDNFVPFVKFSTSRLRVALGTALISPHILAYRSGRLSPSKIRQAVSRAAFFGREHAELAEFGRRYAKEVIPGGVRDSARRDIERHLEAGDRVVVVSASLDLYLAPWCEAEGLELISTRLEVRGDRVSGEFADGDCTGLEKKRRVVERFDFRQFGSVSAYGDTPDDAELLSLAQHRFYRGEPLLGELPFRR
jgi:HAD superfamily hydrolase (TIGR01490 family)